MHRDPDPEDTTDALDRAERPAGDAVEDPPASSAPVAATDTIEDELIAEEEQDDPGGDALL